VIWSDIFLGVIAAATTAMAVVLVGMVVAAGRLARRLVRLLDQLEVELKPLFQHLNAIGRDASRAAALATAQVERVDRALNDVAVRVEQAIHVAQYTLGAPAREGWAVMNGIIAAVRAVRGGRRSRGEEEDALFI
jgi:hypothetical protein